MLLLFFSYTNSAKLRLKKLPVIGVVLASVISCVILYMFMLS